MADNHDVRRKSSQPQPVPCDTPRMVKDPVCEMMVNPTSALRSDIGGRTFYFCSSGCQRTFEAPDEELRRMKRRATIAMAGVLVLAILRVAVFLGLAAGATLLTWAPIDALPWFTWGAWIMILVTPVQFIGGAGFYKGAFEDGAFQELDAMVTDPVCAMSVQPGDGTPHFEHVGARYWFCSTACRDDFRTQPNRYLTSGTSHLP